MDLKDLRIQLCFFKSEIVALIVGYVIILFVLGRGIFVLLNGMLIFVFFVDITNHT